jgi:hypothetical protein
VLHVDDPIDQEFDVGQTHDILRHCRPAFELHSQFQKQGALIVFLETQDPPVQ